MPYFLPLFDRISQDADLQISREDVLQSIQKEIQSILGYRTIAIPKQLSQYDLNQWEYKLTALIAENEPRIADLDVSLHFPNKKTMVLEVRGILVFDESACVLHVEY